MNETISEMAFLDEAAIGADLGRDAICSAVREGKPGAKKVVARRVAKRDGDHPLGCHWRPIAADAFAVLNLPPMPGAAATVRNQILAEAYVVGLAEPDRWISYSRRRASYALRRSRYRSRTYTYDRVVPAVDHLAALGLLDHQKMPPGNLKWQSRFKASQALLEALNQSPPVLVHEPRESIRLRDQDDELVPYKDTSQTWRWRRNLKKINSALLSVTIGLKDRPIREGDPLRVGRANIGAATVRLHRVFNLSSFLLGGRFYGGWWQNIPKASRAHITINGAPTVEMDYPRLHPTLLYAECGQPMHGEPYDIPGIKRSLVKVAFNTLVNADTRIAAIRAIAEEIGGEGAFAKAEALVHKIETKHAPIAHKFGTGAGRRLMRRDSDMTEYLLLRLIKRGIVALPVHDSYIVRASDKGALLEAMAMALRKFVTKTPVKSAKSCTEVPQDGASSSASGAVSGAALAALPSNLSMGVPSLGMPPAGCIAMVLPALAGSGEVSIPVSGVLSWNGGVAPAGVQRGLRHEMQRRSLCHADVSDRLGVSCSQFDDIMHGRSAASPDVAARIRDILVEGAKTVGISVGHPAPLVQDQPGQSERALSSPIPQPGLEQAV
jgi:hypothetical protein